MSRYDAQQLLLVPVTMACTTSGSGGPKSHLAGKQPSERISAARLGDRVLLGIGYRVGPRPCFVRHDGRGLRRRRFRHRRGRGAAQRVCHQADGAMLEPGSPVERALSAAVGA
jgi:hypothetical protein